MKLLSGVSVIAVLLALPAAFAQNQPSNAATPSQSSTSSDQNLAAATKIQQDLKNAGFTDVKVVAESFVVQAKSKDGNPVLMTIGPHGMSVFEAMSSGDSNTANPSSGISSQSGTTGSATSPRGNTSK